MLNGSAAHSTLHVPPSAQTIGFDLEPNVAAVHAPDSLQYIPPLTSWPLIISRKQESASPCAI